MDTSICVVEDLAFVTSQKQLLSCSLMHLIPTSALHRKVAIACKPRDSSFMHASLNHWCFYNIYLPTSAKLLNSGG